MLTTLAAAALSMTLQTAPAATDAAPAGQSSTLPPVEVTGEPETPPQSRMVCRTETVVGTRMPQRVCMTQGHREDRSRDSRALAQRMDVQNSRTRPLASSAGRGGD